MNPRIGVIACSSPVGLVELDRGLDRLRHAGFDVTVHPDTTARHFVNAGTDLQRARALLDFAYDDTIDVIWCARGGYGAARTISVLNEQVVDRPAPRRKLLVGYSDVTFLHEYVRQTWGWRTLHAPMVSANPPPSDAEFEATLALVRNETPTLPYTSPTLRWLSTPPTADIVAEVVGGNLCLWTTLAGTRWQPSTGRRILFFEDLGEKLYRLDRYVVQLEQAGMFDGAAAIVLGDFTDCDDEAPTMLSSDGVTRVPMRPTLSLEDGLLEIFGRISNKLSIPLAIGLPVGHGPNFNPLELGRKHRLTRDGRLIPE